MNKSEFQVLPQNAPWPTTQADLESTIKMMRRRSISEARKKKLDSINFEWQLRAQPYRLIVSEKPTPQVFSKTGKVWEKKYDILKLYVEEHGNARVPSTLNTEKYPKLGPWVARQRKAYRCEKRREDGEIVPSPYKISQVRIARLEQLGFKWTGLKRVTWEEKVELLRKFVQEHGHTRVPVTLDTTEYPKLGSWVKSQRKAYRNEMLIKEGSKPRCRERIAVWQIAMLESFGFEWKGLQSSAWQAKFSLLQQYVREKGNARVPAKLKSDKYPGLGVWVRTQRKAYRNKVMAPLLAKIGKKRKNKKGMHNINDLQIAKLQGLGFEWVVGKVRGLEKIYPEEYIKHDIAATAIPVQASVVSHTVKNGHKQTVDAQTKLQAVQAQMQVNVNGDSSGPPNVWDRKFQLLQSYLREYGNTNVPESLDSVKYPRLGAWIAAQRLARRNERLRASGVEGKAPSSSAHPPAITGLKIAKLDRIGFKWDISKQSRWDIRFALLQHYVLEHGHARVPRSLDTSKYPKLGNWVSHQRQAYRNEQIRAAGGQPKQTQVISPSQIAKMEALGFEWTGLREWDWESKFALLRQYIVEHGTARVPSSFNTPKYPKLGSWVQAQRQAFRSEKIRLEREREAFMANKNAKRIASVTAKKAGTKLPSDSNKSVIPIAACEKEGRAVSDVAINNVQVPSDGSCGKQHSNQGGGTTTSRLSELQIAKLHNIGFEWQGAKMLNWEANLKLLQNYVLEFGHARVPQRLDNEKYPKLGRWVSRQREAYRNEKLRAQGLAPKGTQKVSPKQIRRLERLGITWVVPRTKKAPRRKPKTIGKPSEAWERNLKLLKQYKDKFHNTRVPQRREIPGFPKLGRWVSRQREAYRNEQIRARGGIPKGTNKLTEIQIKKLTEIGMEWKLSHNHRRAKTKASKDRVAGPPKKRRCIPTVVAVQVPVGGKVPDDAIKVNVALQEVGELSAAKTAVNTD